jgi:hypothetical protein
MPPATRSSGSGKGDPLAERRHRGDGEQQSKRDLDDPHERMVAQQPAISKRRGAIPPNFASQAL